MAESLINSIARLRVIEKRLLTKELVGRLASAPGYEECLKILSEAGYGSEAREGAGDEIEALTRAQLTETYALIDELMPKRYSQITELFRMRHDITNVKLLYKLRLMGREADGAPLDFGGVYDAETLKAAVKKGDYSVLPKELKDTLEELDVITYKDPDPQEVSCRIDNAYMRYAQGLRNGFVKEYFGALADFTNLLAVLRGVEPDKLLPGGEVSEEELVLIRDTVKESPEKALTLIKSPLETSPIREKLREGLSEYIRTGRTSGIERVKDEYLISLASKRRSDIDSPAPIIGYLLAREREAEVVRLILTAKRSGIPAEALEERSMALYG